MEKVTFNQRLDGSDRIIQIAWGRAFQAEGKPAAEALDRERLACLRNSKERQKWSEQGEEKMKSER